MILNNSINAGNFIYCMASLTPHEQNTYHNTGDGHFHQCVYIVDGYGFAEIRDVENGEITEFIDAKEPGSLIDLTHTRDKYHTTKTTDSSYALLFFNPIPSTRKLNVQILKGPISQTITAGTNRIVVVCITGEITTNDKTLVSLQHAKVFPGKTVELSLPENAVCALVTEL